MLSVKQGGIKYNFLSLWYDSAWDWTQVSRAIDEHSNHYALTHIIYGLWDLILLQIKDVELLLLKLRIIIRKQYYFYTGWKMVV